MLTVDQIHFWELLYSYSMLLYKVFSSPKLPILNYPPLPLMCFKWLLFNIKQLKILVCLSFSTVIMSSSKSYWLKVSLGPNPAPNEIILKLRSLHCIWLVWKIKLCLFLDCHGSRWESKSSIYEAPSSLVKIYESMILGGKKHVARVKNYDFNFSFPKDWAKETIGSDSLLSSILY